MIVKFTALGRPAPQGSMKAFMVKGKPRLTSQLKTTMPFRQQVGWTALRARADFGYNDILFAKQEPVAATFDFYFAPPKKMPKGRTEPTVPPDTDKLCRAVFDAIRGIIYVDDAQVVKLTARKMYGLPERAEITLMQILNLN